MALSLSSLKEQLREGAYAWPGGYPKYFIMDDGDTMSFEAVKANLREVMRSTYTNARDGWQIDAYDVNWEDADMVCCHSGKPIPSAYGED